MVVYARQQFGQLKTSAEGHVSQTMRYTELSTLLTRIEAYLNSKQLIALYDDSEGNIGDVLIGRPLNYPLPEAPENRLRYWQRLQKMLEHFWRHWLSEYLNTLKTRNKWTRSEPNVQPGDVVIIRGENLPPSVWRVGQVIDVHPDSDGLVRTVTIQYNTNQTSSNGLPIKQRCQRPVQKLCRLTGPTEELLNREGSRFKVCKMQSCP
ncbi:PREDICTED: uncharacterized protein LOC108973173 [Bactrocera latifrons]|uniref:uncharacterized protein LOC108973173 n=1 Tax=Bactrocera latifrons TaxID=174628 RepID=UPI0008DD754F|nr:PREDICTED: uncharacterized protein LOC108973173 [Bactrocera latifrons]